MVFPKGGIENGLLNRNQKMEQGMRKRHGMTRIKTVYTNHETRAKACGHAPQQRAGQKRRFT